MSNVFLKNKTSSAIPVAGYTVHYMDKTDAEIVEVEGVENITSSDDASGTIAAVTLPTAHSYTGVLFDSLRYYASGRISNTGSAFNLWQSSSTWYYGTITWTDESLGDLSDKIIVNSTSSSAMKTQTVFRIIFIYDSNISGYHPMDTAESSQGQITNYSYNNGVHSITFYFAGTNWTSGTFSGRIQFRYLDGVTAFNNLNAFDLVSASGGLLSKNTTSIRYDMYNVWNNSITIHAQYNIPIPVKYNAFKYLLSSVPYWYVIDGIQTDWIDDLSSIGYSEVQTVVLPEVSIGGDFGSYNWLYATNGGSVWSISANSSLDLWNSTVSGYVKVSYDSSKAYAAIMWYSGTGVSDKGENGTLSVLNNSGYIAAKNETSSSVNLYSLRCAVCSSNQATVVLVYNSQNAYFNAFKYTVDSVDYYYVLDGTQNDWTNDLSSIGYEIKDFEEITVYGDVSTPIECQNNITKSSSANASSSNMVQLYTDEERTIPFEFDYSNDYELGYYSSGAWVSVPIQSIADMPSTTADPANSETVTTAYLLYDTGELWFVCNNSNSGYGYKNQHASFYGSRKLRIRPKEQQQYPLYFSINSSKYNNYSTSGGSNYPMGHNPGTPLYAWIPWSYYFPLRIIVDAKKSAGNSGPLIERLSFNGNDQMTIKTASGYAPSFRCVIITLDEPTYTSWINLTGNTTISANSVTPLLNKDGSYVEYEDAIYTVLSFWNYNGGYPVNSGNNYTSDAKMGALDSSNPTRLCFKYGSHSDVSVSSVWYIKTMASYLWLTANGNETIYQNSYPLKDATGQNIPFDSTKMYTIDSLLNADGTHAYNESSILNGYCAIGEDIAYPGVLCFRQYYVTGGASFQRIRVAERTVTTITAYLTSSGSSSAVNTSLTTSTTYTMYDASGTVIPYDTTKRYKAIAIHTIDGSLHWNTSFASITSYSSETNGLRGRVSRAMTVYTITFAVY